MNTVFHIYWHFYRIIIESLSAQHNNNINSYKNKHVPQCIQHNAIIYNLSDLTITTTHLKPPPSVPHYGYNTLYSSSMMAKTQSTIRSVKEQQKYKWIEIKTFLRSVVCYVYMCRPAGISVVKRILCDE